MNRDTFDGYVEQYSDRVKALCRSLCCNYADAQDLYQETWLKAMRHFDRYQSDRPFDKWIAAICVNTYKNTFRAFQTSRRMEFATNEQKEWFMNSLAAPSVDRDILLVLRQQIEALPVKYQLIIKLKYFMGFGDQEISQITGLTVSAAKWRLHRAKELLERRMKDER